MKWTWIIGVVFEANYLGMEESALKKNVKIQNCMTERTLIIYQSNERQFIKWRNALARNGDEILIWNKTDHLYLGFM